MFGLRLASLFLLSAFLPLHAKVIESYKIQEIVPLIDENTWVLVDLDNTLFEAKQALGHADWFYEEVQKRMKLGKTREEAIQDFYPHWIKTQKICPVKSVEPHMVSTLKTLQNKGVTVMALTHRQPLVADSTICQVESLEKLHFARTAPYQDELTISASYPTLYKAGILFVGDYNSKAEIFDKFLTRINQKPKKVLFLDDKRKNVEELDALFAKLEISYIGVHYRAIEKADQVYSAEIANFQYRFLDKILSNDAAIVLMEEGVMD